MNTIVIAIISVTTIGLVCSVLLSVVSKVMHVQGDERVTMVRDVLPGANCGVCGFSGCDAYAASIVDGKGTVNKCTPGGLETVSALCNIMGFSEVDAALRQVAVIHCVGNDEVKQIKMGYEGMKSCSGAKLHYSGQYACAFGCMGYGDCLKACPFDAICIEKGLAHIDIRKCTGCGICVKTCPNELIELHLSTSTVNVLCKNTEKGAIVKDKCSKGCIACSKCVKQCPVSAIVVDDFLASINDETCINCGECIEVCPKHCIMSVSACK